MTTVLTAARPRYRQTMPDMFAAVSDLYGRYWSEFFHFAVFDDEDESWDAALQRTHRRYMDELELDRAQRVLELACGRGALTEVLADNTAGTVLGIDISPGQLRHAQRRLRENLAFRLHDIMDVDELPGVFDAALCLDAFCYLPDKALAIEGVASVLEPGGRLLIVDWCRRGDLGGLQQELVLRPFMDAWAIEHLETLEGYRSHLDRAGLEVLDATDLSASVRRNWDLAYQRALDAVRELDQRSLVSMVWDRMRLGRHGARLAKQQFGAALYLKAAFDAGFLRYVHVLARRR
jgi:cyclopropane fatty-acyl-phospholipid synthase-like methyltransferase